MFQAIDVVAFTKPLRDVPPPFLLPILIRFGFAARPNSPDQRRTAIFGLGFLWNPVGRIAFL
jgi:hypothetical protein